VNRCRRSYSEPVWRATDDAKKNIQVGPRPYYLVDQLKPGPLKDKLESCEDKPLKATDFSIGHRGGGTLQFPEHTKQSHEAGARMGAHSMRSRTMATS
jgi:hypothetical protein